MSPKLRLEIMERDGYICQICWKYMPGKVGLKIDHIVPIAKGGRSVPSNLQVLCSVCNGRKGAKVGWQAFMNHMRFKPVIALPVASTIAMGVAFFTMMDDAYTAVTHRHILVKADCSQTSCNDFPPVRCSPAISSHCSTATPHFL